MERMKPKTVLTRESKSAYENFDLAIFITVHSVKELMVDPESFEKTLSHFTNNLKIGRVYIEDYCGSVWATKEELENARDFFQAKGIETAGGIAPNVDGKGEGFVTICYSSDEGRETIRRAVELNAEVFDEMIFDDFYFLNCRCPKCIEKKGTRSWSQFRLEQKEEVTKKLVMETAKKTNPDCNVIVKFPQWFEVFNATGYDLKTDSSLFDSIYTGTETRNNTYAQQHLPKYLSYYTQRYYESAAPGRNLGGWFDPYECTYNLSSYLEQAYLTAFGKAKELTLFCFASMGQDPQFRLFLPALGEALREMDEYLGELGNPVGLASYRPTNARGEDNIHSYLGMCGVPISPVIDYPVSADRIFLAEGAADDSDIETKMIDSLLNGADICVTSGFVRKMGERFETFADVKYSSRKALVSLYSSTHDNGLTTGGSYAGDAQVIIPQLDYATNDVWELAGAYGTDNKWPILLRCTYGKGHINILTIPDDYGDLYHYPQEVWSLIRGFASATKKCDIDAGLNGLKLSDAPTMVSMYAYDNDTFIVRSDLGYTEHIVISVPDGITEYTELITNKKFNVVDGQLVLMAAPMINYVFKATGFGNTSKSLDKTAGNFTDYNTL